MTSSLPRISHRANLRERFEQAGFRSFVEHEAVELILTLCIPRRDVKQAAKALIQRFGNLKGILDADPCELKDIEGIGSVTPTALRVIKETATLYLLQSAEERPVFDSQQKIKDFWQSSIGGLSIEVFEVASLDSQLRLLRNGIDRIAEGTVSQAVVYPRKIIESALKHSASAIILAHNHPSGIPLPSEYDIQLTNVLKFICMHLEIRILDHLILSPEGSYSFCNIVAEENKMSCVYSE